MKPKKVSYKNTLEDIPNINHLERWFIVQKLYSVKLWEQSIIYLL